MIRQWFRRSSRLLASLRERGPYRIFHDAVRKVSRGMGLEAADPYRDWIDRESPLLPERIRQRRWSATQSDPPRIRLVLASEGATRKAVARTLRSLRRQTYRHWDVLYPNADPEAATQQALLAGDADYLGFLRAGDTLSPDALFHFATRIHEAPSRPDVLYCDEDHLAPDGRTRLRPVFKPAWSPEMLLGYDYLGRLTLVRRDVVAEAGGIAPEMDAAAQWDLKLRISCRSDRIVRVPRCLYHNRCDHDVREAYRAGSGGRAVLEEHLRRLGLAGAEAAEQPNGTFRVRWSLPDHPRVSIVVPTRDRPDMIRRCVEGLASGTRYPDKEIILVDNGSTDPETLALYAEWKAAGAVRIVPFDVPFNYSAACNAGAAAATGDFLLFFNNDIEVVAPDWLEELMRWAQLPGVGIVGPKMIFPDGRVNHAGIAVALGAYINLYWGHTADRWSIFGHVDSYRNFSGLIGACQLMARDLFERLGGYDERFLLVCSDIDICLRARAAGLRLVYDPYALLVHHESTTRQGIGDPSDDLDLAAREIVRRGYFEDPYFHPSFAAGRVLPELRPHWEPSAATHFDWLLSEANPGVARAMELDLYDDASVLDVAGPWATGCLPDGWTPERVGPDEEAAACFALDLLRKNASLRRSFPGALREGADSAFCHWLCSEAAASYGLPPSARETIRGVFRSDPSAGIRRLYDASDELQRGYPLASLRPGRARFFRWLLSEGRKRHGFTNAAIWWYLIACDESPAAELHEAYRRSAVWQRFFPDVDTPAGRARFARWLHERHGIDVAGPVDSGLAVRGAAVA